MRLDFPAVLSQLSGQTTFQSAPKGQLESELPMNSTAHFRRLWALSLLGFAAAFLPTAGQAQSIDGRWDATVTVNNVSIPFRIDLSSNGTEVTSYFFNADEKVNPSTQGFFRDGLLDLKFASYCDRTESDAKGRNVNRLL
jgi:hypothetical protein